MMLGMMGFGWILLLLLVAGLAFALGWRPQWGQRPPEAGSGTPMEIVKARYARGEISREEFERMQLDLKD